MDILITEVQLKRIILEQAGSSLISEKGYEAILAFENTKGTVSKDKIGSYTGYTSMNYDISDVKSLEGVISSHIKATIGLKNWFKISDLFRTQIYSFMFNSDSGSVDGYKWIAGLAQAIDSTINRGKIVGKPLTDPNVKDAIKLINETINNGTINNYYSQYLQVLDSQYLKTSESNFITDKNGNKTLNPFHVASYKYSWSVRPKEIEQYYNNPPKKNTTSVKPVEDKKKPVDNTTKDLPVITIKKKTPVTDNGSISFTSPDLGTFVNDIKTKTLDTTLDFKSVKIDVDKRTFSIDTSSTGTKVKKLVLTLSTIKDGSAAADNVIDKNPGSKIVTKGKFEIDSVDKNKYRIYYVIAII